MTDKFVFIFREHKLLGSDYASLVPMTKHERTTVTVTILGQAVMDAINSPAILKERVDFMKLLKDFTSFKSWGAFANATEHHCLVVADENVVQVKPSFKNGRSFSGDKDKVVTCEPTVEAIGSALFATFEN